ncbi:MAG: MFS transporter [Proteobacteria bacterium]|nr:MFS transporter [Pseudomonadota bacterium]
MTVPDAPTSDSPVDLRRLFLILSTAVAVSLLGVGVVVPLLPIFAKHLGAGGILLGLTFSGFSLARAIALPVAGAMSDRYGRKNFLVIGLAVYAACSVAYVFALTPFLLVGIRVVHGLASALILPIALAIVADFTPPEKAGRVVGAFNAPVFIGLGLGPLLGGTIYDLLGRTQMAMDTNFLIMGGVSLGALLMVVIGLPGLPVRRRGQGPRVGMGRLLQDRVFLGVLGLRFTISAGVGSILAFLPVLADHYHISPTAMGICLAAMIFSVALFQRPFGKLADKRSRSALSMICAGICSSSLLLVAVAHNFPMLFMACVVWGLGGGLGLPAMTALVIERGKTLGVGMGRCMGLFNVSLAAGIGLGPVAMGKLWDWFPPFGPFCAGAAAIVLGAAFFGLMIRGQKG